MSIESNKALVRRYYEELWNRWDFALAETLIDPDIAFRGSLGTEVRGRAGFTGYMESVRAAFPDFHNTIEEMIAEGDGVAARLTYEGTHRGELFGIPPTGRRIRYAGVAIFHIAGGRVARGWVLGDTAGLRAQLSP
jgi:steroid delta-isomerase-like uncharacterized protein